MSVVQKRKYTKRNYDQEAELQVKILEQKAREDFLVSFSQCEEETTAEIAEPVKTTRRDESETKVYIPANAKSVLEKWMYEHRLYCYPTKAEKQALALETGLNVQKISNWFINSRRRMLPKMLQTEGKNPVNFTISRKKKKAAAVPSKLEETSATHLLTDYAISEESKVIDQDSIFFGNAIEVHNDPQLEKLLQEIIVPYTGDTDDEDTKLSHGSVASFTSDSRVNCITRGILYDQSTQSKCLFVLVNPPK